VLLNTYTQEKMKKQRIVFFGTPDFAVGVLEKLMQNEYNVVGVVTAADKPAGRGKKIRESAVKKYALQQNLPVLQPKNLKENSFLEALGNLKADLQIIVAFRMLPRVVWQMPKSGTFNLHASLLPAYRGAAPINWAIINGETETGVTTFFIDDKIDTGEILLQERVNIVADETAGILHDKLMQLGSELVLKTVDLIAVGKYKTQKQPDITPKPAPKLYQTNTLIDWHKPLEAIYNKIRGLSPYPSAWTSFVSNDKEYKIKIYASHIELTAHNHKVGLIISTKKTLKIAVKEGYLFLDDVQLSGKKRMFINNLLNGFPLSDDAKIIV